MSEQEYCNSADTFGVRLVNHVDDAVLPVGVHDFADAIGRCMLVDKTMFIADVLTATRPLWCAVDPRVLARA